VNFRECPKGEVRRSPLPRTPVNMLIGVAGPSREFCTLGQRAHTPAYRRRGLHKRASGVFDGPNPSAHSGGRDQHAAERAVRMAATVS
jgi:hypothetical protein